MVPINRLKEIDFLRGLAVILVLFRHFPFSFYTITMGWIGVDLFFVLSGFLVSGLLFSEYQKFGNIRIRLFLIRRGFKIYPLFYIFILSTVVGDLISGTYLSETKLLGELFFVQNYIGRLWNHTWSLAVEEHFYFLLSFLIYFLVQWKLLERKMIFYSTSFIILFGCLITRFIVNYYHPERENFYETHLRFDSLFAGVIISYLYHFDKFILLKFANKFKKLFIPLILLLISFSPFIEPETSFLIRTIGFTFLYIAFGLLLVLILITENAGKKISRIVTIPLFEAIIKIGYHSYSIYIIHLAIAMLVKSLEDKIELNTQLYFIIYFCGSIIAGILLSNLIEIPFLNLRDKYFPKRVADLVPLNTINN